MVLSSLKGDLTVRKKRNKRTGRGCRSVKMKEEKRKEKLKGRVHPQELLEQEGNG